MRKENYPRHGVISGESEMISLVQKEVVHHAMQTETYVYSVRLRVNILGCAIDRTSGATTPTSTDCLS